MTDTAMDEAAPGAASQEEMVATLCARQNFALAVPAGLIAAVIGAFGWAVLGYLTESEFGLVAIAAGALVGLAVRRAGNGVDKRFGILGAVCAALGTVLCDIAFLAKEVNRPVLDTFSSLGVGQSLSLAVHALGAMDVLFLAIAVWEGYKLSFRRA